MAQIGRTGAKSRTLRSYCDQVSAFCRPRRVSGLLPQPPHASEDPKRPDTRTIGECSDRKSNKCIDLVMIIGPIFDSARLRSAPDEAKKGKWVSQKGQRSAPPGRTGLQAAILHSELVESPRECESQTWKPDFLFGRQSENLGGGLVQVDRGEGVGRR